ncbi:MAG: type II secretion system minor pseudopilin GspI [Methylotenera sp.]|nr:type II secretion system minor pseudopilin GspI [Methylotenera sp.]
MRRNQAKGFTLIEVLVAMAILAVALAAASRAAGLAINHSADIKQRVLADMVAQNRLATHLAQDDWQQGSFKGSITQGNVLFQWKEEITPTPNPAFMKIVVTVADPADAGHNLRRLVGFLVNPAYQYAP